MLTLQQKDEGNLIVKNTFLHWFDDVDVGEETSRIRRSASDPLEWMDIVRRNTAQDPDVVTPQLAKDFGPPVSDTSAASSALLKSKDNHRVRLTFPMLNGNEEEADTDSEREPAPLDCYSHIVDIDSEGDNHARVPRKCSHTKLMLPGFRSASLDPAQNPDGATTRLAKDFIPAAANTLEGSSSLLTVSKTKHPKRLPSPMLDVNEDEADTDSERVPAPLKCYWHLVDADSESDIDAWTQNQGSYPVLALPRSRSASLNEFQNGCNLTPKMAEDSVPNVSSTSDASSNTFSASKSKHGERATVPILDGNEDADTDSERTGRPLKDYANLVGQGTQSDAETIASCKTPEVWECGFVSKLELRAEDKLGREYVGVELEQAGLGQDKHSLQPSLVVMVAATPAIAASSNPNVSTPMQLGTVHSVPSVTVAHGGYGAKPAHTPTPLCVADVAAVVLQEPARVDSVPTSCPRRTLQLDDLIDAVAADAMPQTPAEERKQLYQRPLAQQSSVALVLKQKQVQEPASERHRQTQQRQQRMQPQQQGQRSSKKKTFDGKDPPAMEPCDPTWTTLMIRNIPNNYNREMLLATFCKEGFAEMYDFVYLPIDFRTSAALGYAFLNLTTHDAARQFWRSFSGYSKWSIPSKKSCEVCWSEPYQGLAANIERYRKSPVMHPSVNDEHKPQIFCAGVPVDFPLPTRNLRAPRVRGLGKQKTTN